MADTTVLLGAEFDRLAGVKATDAEDGDLTGDIRVTGEVDTAAIGQYTLQYSVTDSGNQTVRVERNVTVSDGSSCANAWDAKETYLQGAQVSHNGATWEAGWWTRGEEPGTTGEWGVWKKVSDSSCGGETPDPELGAELKVSGLASEYVADNGEVRLALELSANKALDVTVMVADSTGTVVNQAKVNLVDSKVITIDIFEAKEGRYTLDVVGSAEDGEMVVFTAPFMVKEQGTVTPPPGDYPPFQAGTNYQAGDIVVAADNGLYQCKPWPYTGWCSSASYAPADSLYWQDAWDKL